MKKYLLVLLLSNLYADTIIIYSEESAEFYASEMVKVAVVVQDFLALLINLLYRQDTVSGGVNIANAE